MSKIDYLGLDGRALKTFITVMEEGSVSRAAERLFVSQSAVSHTLEKLRATFGDPLFVRAGRGILPTAKAKSLYEPIEGVLAELKALTSTHEFDPMSETIDFTIAVNDPPMQLIFPTLLKELYAEGIEPRLRFIPSGIPSANFRRALRCQILITPAPPEAKDLFRQELFRSKAAVFYDGEMREAPKSRTEFEQSQHVEVQFSHTETSAMAILSLDRAAKNPATVAVPNFNALPAFIKGTNLITTQLGFMGPVILKDLDCSPLPMKTKDISIYMVWHQRDHDDPAHTWLRQRILDTTRSIVGE